MSVVSLQQLLVYQEGKRSKPYLDCCGKYWRMCTCQKKGKLTIGVGRNLDDEGLGDDEIMTLCRNDIQAAEEIACQYVWYRGLDDTRKDVVVSMIFNLGQAGFDEFKKFQNALRRGDYDAAANEMMFSLWANQVGNRAKELSQMMRTGIYINLEGK